MSAKRALQGVRVPGERAAEKRVWEVVCSVYQEQELIADRRPLRRHVLAVVIALALGAFALSPAGATVGRFITRTLGVRNSSPALSSLPAPGRLLVSSQAGTWTVAADGSLRRLGSWPEASWSPHGRYVAAIRPGLLSAVDPRGTLQWALGRPDVSDARWYTPSGYRVAYLSADDLRVVAGDGTGDHLLAPHVVKVAPAWRPGHGYQLAYVASGGRLKVRGADTKRLIWSRAVTPGVQQLQWSADGRYLVAVSRTAARLYTASGAPVSVFTAPRGGSLLDTALSPDGQTVALVVGGRVPEVVLENVLTHGPPRRVLAGVGLRQVLWSPDGRWLLISWPAADQWVFARVEGKQRIAAVSHIAQQFSAGRQSGGFPQLEGWCCVAGH